MASYTTAFAIILALGSGYSLSVSASSIPKLQKYEDKAKKAAEWSSTADKQLWDTRYTVGAGFVATTTSLLSALPYALFISRGGGLVVRGWPLLMSAGMYYTRVYMEGFWGAKAKIPLVDEYNEAISDNTTVIWFANLLATGWAVVGLLKVVGL